MFCSLCSRAASISLPANGARFAQKRGGNRRCRVIRGELLFAPVLIEHTSRILCVSGTAIISEKVHMQ